MRHRRDPRRHGDRRKVQILTFSEPKRDKNGDPTSTRTETVLWEGLATIQPWLPRYNVPTAPVTGGVPERRVAARTYLPPEAPMKQDGIRLYDVDGKKYYSVISSALEMAGENNLWRVDLGAPRVLNG